MTRLLHVRADGDAAAFGRLHGAQARELIRDNLKLYFHRFTKEWGVSREEVLRRARMYLEVIDEVDPEYVEAMEGIAEGADVDLLEVVALNVRYEIVYSAYSELGRGLRAPGECTAVGLQPSATRNGHLLLSQNWDWIPGIRGMMQEVALPGRPRVLAFTEAGIAGGKIGLNDRGLGMLINGLISSEDNWERMGVPFHVRCWQALQAPRLDEALDRIRDAPTSCSANFLLGHAGEGGVVNLETSPVGTAEMRPDDGVLIHTNHFHREDDLGIWQPLIEGRTTTFERQTRMEELVADGRGSGLDLESLRAFLTDHTGRPACLCRHPELDLPEEQRYQTVVSVLMDLDERRMLVADGPPCETPFEEFGLTQDRPREG